MNERESRRWVWVRIAYGQRPREHLVDGGFAKLDDIDALAGKGVAVYAPPPTPRTGRDLSLIHI